MRTSTKQWNEQSRATARVRPYHTRAGKAEHSVYGRSAPWRLTCAPSRISFIRQLCWTGLLILAIFLASCGGSSQPPPDPRLKAFHILSERIIMQDNQAEVDGTIQNTGHDPFPFDVTIGATFYDSAGKVIGQAQGTAEDVFPGTIGPFILVGQVNSVRYSRMQLTPVSLRERRVENFTPTPPVSP